MNDKTFCKRNLQEEIKIKLHRKMERVFERCFSLLERKDSRAFLNVYRRQKVFVKTFSFVNSFTKLTAMQSLKCELHKLVPTNCNWFSCVKFWLQSFVKWVIWNFCDKNRIASSASLKRPKTCFLTYNTYILVFSSVCTKVSLMCNLKDFFYCLKYKKTSLETKGNLCWSFYPDVVFQ